MGLLNIRLTADESMTENLVNRLGALDGVERAEEIQDLMPHMDDPDSTSSGLRGDMGPGHHAIIVETCDDDALPRVRAVARAVAAENGLAVEFEDNAEWGARG
ncbi:MAG TPA: hypothetical protein VFG73_08880 [Rhodanobacteraceae bacterium]|nr:hypothetical protein [Rhodanobacteraceae bacterium]